MSELRKLAEAATPGPWKVVFPENGDMNVEWHVNGRAVNVVASWPGEVWGESGREGADMRDAVYIAAVSPDVVLRLLDEIEGLKEQLGAAGYVPRPALPPKFITEPNYDEPTVPPPLTEEG